MRMPAPTTDDRDAWKAYLEVVAPANEAGCWVWSRSTDTSGYGIVSINRKTRTVHRIAFRVWKGDTGGLCVLHKCDNRRCCNPEHLFLGTRAENNKDRDEKGRHVALPGSKSGMAKLDELRVAEIRRLKGRFTQREIARQFGVDRSLVGLILANKIWKHVQP